MTHEEEDIIAEALDRSKTLVKGFFEDISWADFRKELYGSNR